jgi:hypothetical protein
MDEHHPRPRCPRCGADLATGAAMCARCGAPVAGAASGDGLAEQYREGQRLLDSPALRAVYLLPVVIPGGMLTVLVVSKLVPKPYEDVVADVLGGLVGLVVFSIIGAVLFASARSAAKGGRFHVLPYALPAAGIVLGLAAQLAPHPLALVLQVLAGACMVLSIPAVLLSTVLRGQAAQRGPAAAPAKVDAAAIQQAARAFGASFAEALRATPKAFEPAAAPFDESPAARAARLQQLHAMNGMLRAARRNAAPFLAIGKLMLAGFPVVMLLIALLGVVTVVQGVVTGHLPPKTSIGDGVVMIFIGAGTAAAFHRFVIAPHQRLGQRVRQLAAHVGSAAVAGHATAMLDWLDQHWPDFVPSSGPAAMGWHWIVPFTFRARPALLSVLHDLGGRGTPSVRRIDVYLACPCNAPLLDAAAVASVRALGFEAVQSPAGVRLERRDNDPAALAPEVLDALLRAVAR